LVDDMAAQMKGNSMTRQVAARNSAESTNAGRRRRTRGGGAEVIASAAPKATPAAGALAAGAGWTVMLLPGFP
jgi:hypothetical protein